MDPAQEPMKIAPLRSVAWALGKLYALMEAAKTLNTNVFSQINAHQKDLTHAQDSQVHVLPPEIIVHSHHPKVVEVLCLSVQMETAVHHALAVVCISSYQAKVRKIVFSHSNQAVSRKALFNAQILSVDLLISIVQTLFSAQFLWITHIVRQRLFALGFKYAH